MTRNEAIISLLKCHSLIEALVTSGFDKELDNKNQEALKGFCKVWASGWLSDLEIQETARLGPLEIELLIDKMVQEVISYKKS